jgi:hypothetical protein
MLPVSVIEKTSVIEWHPPSGHNRARGKHHEVELQVYLVGMLKLGWDEPRQGKSLK